LRWREIDKLAEVITANRIPCVVRFDARIISFGIGDERGLALYNVPRQTIRHQLDALVLDKYELGPGIVFIVIVIAAPPFGCSRHMFYDSLYIVSIKL
jgi:hypothetical protein